MYRLLAIPTLALAAACTAAPSPAQPGPVPEVTVAEARAAGAGATVRVEGIVTVPPGVFDGGFAIQDRTAGLWVLPLSTGVPLRLGQRVRVHGTLDTPNGQLSLQASAVQALGMRPVPAARQLATGEVDAGAEGWLVRVRGRVQGEPVDAAPWGWKVALDDGSGPVGVFVDADTDVDPSGFRPGETVEVTGFVGRYAEELEILPRARGDVRGPPLPR